jgi:hypothetical protein
MEYDHDRETTITCLNALAVLQTRRHWFLDAIFKEDSGYIYITFVLNLSAMELDCLNDPQQHLPSAQDLLHALPNKAVLQDSVCRTFRKVVDATNEDGDRTALLPRETEDAHISGAHRALLHGHQRVLVGWLRHVEEQILRGDPIARIDTQLRPKSLRGTTFSFDLRSRHEYHGEQFYRTERTPYDPTLCIDAPSDPLLSLVGRGVVVSDATGLGKTRASVEFLLGRTQELDLAHLRESGDPTMTTGAAPRDRLLVTRATDCGMYNSQFEDALAGGLLFTRASLVVVANTTVTTWQREIAALFPEKRVIVLTNKNDHVKITYLDVATADLVIVTSQFLSNRAYYEKVRWPDIAKKTRFVRSFDSLSKAHEESLGTFAIHRAELLSEAFCNTKAPILDWFAWERLVIDECHEFVAKRSARLCDTGLSFFSARFVVALTATPQHDMDEFQLFVLRRLMRLGYQWATPQSPPTCPATNKLKIRFHNVPAYLARGGYGSRLVFDLGTFYADEDMAGWNNPGTNNVISGTTTAKQSYFIPRRVGNVLAFVIAYQAIRAIFWRNTRLNTERDVPVPPRINVALALRPHPAFDCLDTIYDQLTEGEYEFGHFPFKVEDMAAETSEARQHLSNSYADAWARVIEYTATLLTNLGQAISRVDAVKDKLEKKLPVHTDSPWATLLALKLSGYDARFEPLLEKMRALQQACFSVPFYSPLEERWGTRAFTLLRVLEAIFERQPNERVIVASGYRCAMGEFLKRAVAERLGVPFVTLGGMNGTTTRKNETLFIDGSAKLLFLDTNQAAAGLNLQCASFLVDFDDSLGGRLSQEQIVSRVHRQGAKRPPVFITFRVSRDKQARTVIIDI